MEEQFYLFFPMLVAACLWWTRRFKGSATARIARWLVVVGVISLALCLLLTFVRLPVPVGGLVAFYSPFTRAWEFVAGALLALAFQRGWSPPRLARFSGPLGAGVLVVGLVVIQGGARFPGWYAVIPVVATVLLLLACVGEHPGARVLTSKPMVYIGDISYGWYLFHWPLIAFAGIAWQDGPPVVATIVVAVLGFALAAGSHRWIEQPIRERRVLGTMRAPVLMALVVLPAVLASVGLILGAQRGWGQQDVRNMQAQLDHGQWQYQEVCQSWVPVDERDFSACRIEGDPDKRPLILMGDSNAGVYAELMVEVASQLDRTVTIATVPSCPLVDVETVAPDGASLLDCRDMFRSSMDWLAEQPSSTVVMASGGGAVDLEEYALRLPQGGSVRDVAGKGDAWRASLERSYTELGRMGHEVIQVELAPHFDWRPSGCSFVKILRDDVASCGVSESRADADADAAGALAGERRAVEAAGIRTIEVRDALCPQSRCRTNEGNFWYYEDGVHLSFAGALSLEPTFVSVLRDDPRPEQSSR